MIVLLISPEKWGTMRVSKHHYAVELVKQGHVVYFLNPQDTTWGIGKATLEISESGVENLKLVDYKTRTPYNLKYHVKWMYDVLITPFIGKLEKRIGRIDLVWSFDLTGSMPLKVFRGKKKIFFAADWPLNKSAIKSAETADLFVSISKEIAEQFPAQLDKLLIEHAVSEYFIKAANKTQVMKSDKMHIALSGNFFRTDIDRSMLLKIIRQNPDFIFEFFGTINNSLSNLGGTINIENERFYNEILGFSNTIVHGALETSDLALEFRRMDGFLICYDAKKCQSKATNYHKVSEFIVYNKPIVSSYIKRFDFDSSGVEMSTEVPLDELFFEVFVNKKRTKSFGYFPPSYQSNLKIILERISLK